VSALPIVLRGETLSAVVVGGGPVGRRKAATLAAAGVVVRVVDPDPSAALHAVAAEHASLSVVARAFEPADLDGAHLVVAATGDRGVNAAVAAAARRAGRLVNVTDAPDEGDWTSPATHRSGELVLAVIAGGVPGAAVRVRDEVAARFDARYADAVAQLASLRRRLLDAGEREAWAAAEAELVGADFCAAVEGGDFVERVRRWG
jgi:cobalt-precorrin 5A hydrolase/precorrin-3B C17-methyltransferase